VQVSCLSWFDRIEIRGSVCLGPWQPGGVAGGLDPDGALFAVFRAEDATG